jgi:hypothetical protein
MRFPFCPEEEKIAKLLSENRWDRDADPELLAHVEKCPGCSEVVFGLQILRQGRDAGVSNNAGSPGYLWWRAQLRRKNGAFEQAARPVVWAELLALILVILFAGAFAFLQWGQFRDWFLIREGSIALWAMLGGLSAVICLGGLALYFSD